MTPEQKTKANEAAQEWAAKYYGRKVESWVSDASKSFLAGVDWAMTWVVLNDGGEGIGQVYGPTNCSACSRLTPDYYFIGKGYLCTECWERFPAALRRSARAKGSQNE